MNDSLMGRLHPRVIFALGMLAGSTVASLITASLYRWAS